MAEQSKKAILYYVYKILKEKSDENHPLTQQNIIDELQNYGLNADRKTVGSTIDMLRDFGYDIFDGQKRGVYLYERVFSQEEIMLIIDSIYSSKALDGQTAKEIIDKVLSTLSDYQKKEYALNYLTRSDELTRTQTRNAVYNVSAINNAINNRHAISFLYPMYGSDRQKHYQLTESGEKRRRYIHPRFVVNNYGNYYCLCTYYNHEDRLYTFRLDRMEDIKEEVDKQVEPLSSYEKFKNFDIVKYLNTHIYLFSDETRKVVVKVNNPRYIADIYDWFGHNTEIYEKDGDVLATIQCSAQGIYYWLKQYEDYFTLIEPDDINKLKTGETD